jgi:hypothetical protein
MTLRKILDGKTDFQKSFFRVLNFFSSDSKKDLKYSGGNDPRPRRKAERLKLFSDVSINFFEECLLGLFMTLWV